MALLVFPLLVEVDAIAIGELDGLHHLAGLCFHEGNNADYALGSFFVDNVYLYKATSTSLEDTQIQTTSQKIIRDGVLYIIRNGVTYDVMGRVIR